MKIALKEAKKAWIKQEVPVGAVLVKDDKIIAQAHNCSISYNDPTAHAEVLVLRRGAKKLNNYRLNGTSLYVTLEPCPLCVGAMIHARVERLIFGAYDPKGGAAGSLIDLTDGKKFNHKIKVTGGILEEECKSLIQAFFSNKR